MNIAVFTDRFYPNIDGISVHVTYISKLLSQRGHTVHLFAPTPESKDNRMTSSKNLVLRYMPSFTPPMNDVRMALPFSFSLLNHDFIPDVIHFHTTFTIGLQGILTAKMLGIPLIGTFHTYFMEPEYLKSIGVKPITLDKLNKTDIVQKMGWNYANFFYNKADLVIAPTQYTKKDLIENHVSSKIIVISNGIDCTAGKKKKVEFDLPEKYLLYVGRLSEEKNLARLIRSYARFQKNITGIPLVIVGDGPYRNEMEKLISNLGIKNKVILLGKVENDIILNSNIYDNALAFVTASKIENQPISVLESLKFGLPSIGVASRGMTELIDKNGILCKSDSIVELSSAMHSIVHNVQLRKACRAEAYKMAKKHSVEHTLDQLEKVYKNLASKSKKNKKEKHTFIHTLSKAFQK